MPSPIQQEILDGTRRLMRPIVRFLLRSGISFREFADVCKIEYVKISTDEYGIRGRPTNVSRVAVMTGLTRKEIKSIRDAAENAPMETKLSDKLNPPTQVLHYWHNDSFFLDKNGTPLALQISGASPSFSDLVKKYAGDIPPGAMLVELKRAGAVTELEDGGLVPSRSYYIPMDLDEKFIRSMSFSLQNLADTLVHNAKIASESGDDASRNYERYIWSSTLSEDDIEEFQEISQKKAAELLAELDNWIGIREQIRLEEQKNSESRVATERTVGLGVYFFRRTSTD